MGVLVTVEHLDAESGLQRTVGAEGCTQMFREVNNPAAWHPSGHLISGSRACQLDLVRFLASIVESFGSIPRTQLSAL